ncbi:MAG: DUF481 domain-containing protein [Candidatus Cyclonatronum sp.]|uniref:DUF481 domain-containing protein n=1 Tax=Cyclonatronum sp. TaxID=3024185 RepID=UPI0025C17990|nr:DUF481 domain-containing protein [Cyclonatronum sp.]MCC5932625.1 DUF481 domain-containing protein [Balneolales bacterium]MCH8486009.1 DUF481 domain-containing protein [Cyclonatronum sp.]
MPKHSHAASAFLKDPKASLLPQTGLLVLLLLIFIIPQPVSVHAQVLNIESLRMEADTSKSWAGNLSFGFSASKQDSETIQLNSSATLIHFGKVHSHLMLTNLNLLTIDDELVNNGYVHLRGTYWYRRTWSPEIFTQLQYSEDWGLRRRALLGGGMRHNTVQTNSFTAGITSGLMYEHEVWRPEEAPRVEYNRLKSTTSLLMRGKLTPTTNLYIVGYYQAEPQRFGSPRLTADAELRFQISRLIRFSAQFSTTYDYNPPPDVVSWIYSFRNSFSFVF